MKKSTTPKDAQAAWAEYLKTFSKQENHPAMRHAFMAGWRAGQNAKAGAK